MIILVKSIISLIILIALVKVLIVTNKPILCSGMYTFAIFIMSLILLGNTFFSALVMALIALTFALIYFILLDRFKNSPKMWWTIVITGLLVGLV